MSLTEEQYISNLKLGVKNDDISRKAMEEYRAEVSSQTLPTEPIKKVDRPTMLSKNASIIQRMVPAEDYQEVNNYILDNDDVENFYRFSGQFLNAVKGQKINSATVFISLWDRFKEKLEESFYTGIETKNGPNVIKQREDVLKFELEFQLLKEKVQATKKILEINQRILSGFIIPDLDPIQMRATQFINIVNDDLKAVESNLNEYHENIRKFNYKGANKNSEFLKKKIREITEDLEDINNDERIRFDEEKKEIEDVVPQDRYGEILDKLNMMDINLRHLEKVIQLGDNKQAIDELSDEFRNFTQDRFEVYINENNDAYNKMFSELSKIKRAVNDPEILERLNRIEKDLLSPEQLSIEVDSLRDFIMSPEVMERFTEFKGNQITPEQLDNSLREIERNMMSGIKENEGMTKSEVSNLRKDIKLYLSQMPAVSYASTNGPGSTQEQPQEQKGFEPPTEFGEKKGFEFPKGRPMNELEKIHYYIFDFNINDLENIKVDEVKIEEIARHVADLDKLEDFSDEEKQEVVEKIIVKVEKAVKDRLKTLKEIADNKKLAKQQGNFLSDLSSALKKRNKKKPETTETKTAETKDIPPPDYEAEMADVDDLNRKFNIDEFTEPSKLRTELTKLGSNQIYKILFSQLENEEKGNLTTPGGEYDRWTPRELLKGSNWHNPKMAPDLKVILRSDGNREVKIKRGTAKKNNKAIFSKPTKKEQVEEIIFRHLGFTGKGFGGYGLMFEEPYNKEVNDKFIYDPDQTLVEKERQKKGREDNYALLGKYLIHLPSLHQGYLNLKYVNSYRGIKNHPKERITNNIQKLIWYILKRGEYPADLYKALSKKEKIRFDKIVEFAKLYAQDAIDFLNYKSEMSQEREKDLTRFDLLRGEIMAGNNNPIIIQELKLLILKLYKDKSISRDDYNEIIHSIALIA